MCVACCGMYDVCCMWVVCAVCCVLGVRWRAVCIVCCVLRSMYVVVLRCVVCFVCWAVCVVDGASCGAWRAMWRVRCVVCVALCVMCGMCRTAYVVYCGSCVA